MRSNFNTDVCSCTSKTCLIVHSIISTWQFPLKIDFSVLGSTQSRNSIILLTTSYISSFANYIHSKTNSLCFLNWPIVTSFVSHCEKLKVKYTRIELDQMLSMISRRLQQVYEPKTELKKNMIQWVNFTCEIISEQFL